jgi:nucleoside-diphosphate-sugar epimerase
VILPARVLMTGATGNTGSFVVNLLRQRHPQLEVVALVRPGRDVSALRTSGLSTLELDFQQPQILFPHLRSSDVLLSIANLRFARTLLPVFAQAGARRAFCVTTTAVFSTFHSYSALYREIESELQTHGVDVTLLRPSMIYGNERDYNMHKLLRVLSKTPVFPVFGSGEALMQPVHVEDLAAGIVAALERDAGGAFNLAGPTGISYNRVLRDCVEALGRKVAFMRVPHGGVAALVKILQGIPGFPVQHEQVMRLLEDKAFDIEPARQQLAYSPRDFRVGIQDEVHRLRQVGVIS